MRRFRRTLCLMAALTAGTLSAATGECTLKGLYEGRLDFGWSTAGIWKDGYVPAADDDVAFPTKPARTMTVRLPSVDGFRRRRRSRPRPSARRRRKCGRTRGRPRRS